jgi:hypothetical protein
MITRVRLKRQSVLITPTYSTVVLKSTLKSYIKLIQS